MTHIAKLQDISNVTPITDDLDGWVVTEGAPTMKTWILYTSCLLYTSDAADE